MLKLLVECLIAAYLIGLCFCAVIFLIIISVHNIINSKKYEQSYSGWYKVKVMGKPKPGFEKVEMSYQKALNISFKSSIAISIASAIILFIKNFKAK